MTQNVEAIYYLTPLQHGMLYHSQRTPGSGLYVEQFSCLIVGALRTELFADAWSVVVHRHDALKTLFIRLNQEKPMQVVRGQVTVPFARLDWRGRGEDEQERRFAELLRADRAKGFDISRAPLVRCHLITLGPDRHRFLWTYHHAVLDGWSMPVVLNEVFQVYAAKLAGRSINLPKPRPYRDYASWMRVQDGAKAAAFWRDFLQNFRAPLAFSPAVAPDTAAPSAQAPAARELATVRAEMPSAWREAASRLCRANRITLNTLCQGAWSVLLGWYGDRDDIVYGTVVSGRPLELAGVESMVGLFINTLPLRVRLANDAPLAEWLKQLQTVNVEIERYGYSALSEILKCSGLPRHQNLFDALYVFENYPGQAEFAKLTSRYGLEVREIRAAEETNYSLALIVVPHDGLTVQLTYDTARFNAGAAQRFLDRYRCLLEQMLDLERLRLAALRPADHEPIAAAPPAPVLAGSNTILALIVRQATACPERPAITGGETEIGYARLAALVTRYRQEWARHGYRPGDRVLIAIDDELLSLVVLLSGIAYGVECVLPDQDVSLSALARRAAGDDARWALCGCVDDGSRAFADLGIKQSAFPGIEELSCDGRSDDAQTACDAVGACSLIYHNPHHGWEVLRYDEPAMVNAMLRFSQAYPAQRAKDVPLAGSAQGHANLWTTLFALGSGLTLRRLGERTHEEFFLAVQTAGGPWHSVRLSPAQTRALSYRASAELTIQADYFVVDATAVTPGVIDRLRKASADARIVKEFRAPARSFPHTRLAYQGQTRVKEEFFQCVGEPAGGARPLVVDRNLRLAATDAFGALAITGASVPSALFGDGERMLVPSPLSHDAGSMLLTNIRAWRSATDAHAQLVSAEACLAAPGARLEEIERQLSALAQIKDVAIADRIADGGEWERAVFYVSGDDALDVEPSLRAACAQRELTVGALVPVAQVPRIQGRIDRHALARGDFETAKHGAYVAPRDDVESTLQSIWQELLKHDRIGVTDDYFDLGGDSLLATVMLYQIEERLAMRIDIETLLEHPTIAELAQAIAAGVTAEVVKNRDLSREIELEEAIVPPTAFDPDTFTAANVFLTGATGFLGVHLLAEVLEKTDAVLHCLVRAADAEAGIARLVAALKKYRLWKEHYLGRLRAIPGELDRPLFGLDDQRFTALAETVDVIYHNGALVNFVYPYGSLKRVNVLATKDIVKLACSHKTKPVHYVSTIGVLDRTRESIAEELAIPAHPQLLGGYEQSKWVAEQILGVASRRGLPVSIYRPSRIVGNSRTGLSNTDDLFCRMIKGIITLGKAPADAGFDNMVPVDVASRVIVDASLQPLAYGRALHVINPQWNSLNAIVDCIEQEGYPVARLGYDAWLRDLEEHAKVNREHPLAMLVPVLKKLNPTVDPSISRMLPIEHGNVTALLGAQALQSIPSVGVLLRSYFDHFYAGGYLSKNDQPMTACS